MQGANVQSMPVPATSRAVTRAAACTSSGSRVQPSAMLCGKIVDALEPAVSVDRVDAVDHRDPEARRQRLALIPVVHLDPAVGGVGARQRVGAAQHRARPSGRAPRARRCGGRSCRSGSSARSSRPASSAPAARRCRARASRRRAPAARRRPRRRRRRSCGRGRPRGPAPPRRRETAAASAGDPTPKHCQTKDRRQTGDEAGPGQRAGASSSSSSSDRSPEGGQEGKEGGVRARWPQRSTPGDRGRSGRTGRWACR